MPTDDIFMLANHEKVNPNSNSRNDRYNLRPHNERLERLEYPLVAGEHWKDVFSGDAALGKPSPTISGPWQVSAFALLGLVVVFSAIFLHMVAEQNSEDNTSPYSAYRRRQRHARRMYKTRKKKTDEWSDDEEDLIRRNGAFVADHQASGGISPGEDAQFYQYNYNQHQTSPGVAKAPANSVYLAQEHRQRRSGHRGPYTPPSASNRNNYYTGMPTYISPSAKILSRGGIQRRGISPRTSLNSSFSSGMSPGANMRVMNPLDASPNTMMRSTAPLSGRQRVPTPPDAQDIFSSGNASGTFDGSGLQGMQAPLPTPLEGSQLATDDIHPLALRTNELGARPLNSSNFSSFASIDGPTDEALSNISSHRQNRRGSSSEDSFDFRHQSTASATGMDSSDSHHLMYSSHGQNLLLSPGNYEASTPQVANIRRISAPNSFGEMIPSIASALEPPIGGETQGMPFIPTLDPMKLSSHGGSHHEQTPRLQASAQPPRSVLMDELRLVQMESGNSTRWTVQDLSESTDVSGSQHSFHEEGLSHGGTVATFDEDSNSESGSDISIPSGDPRKSIIHKRPNLIMDTDAYASLQSSIDFEELELQEVIGGGGFGQVWRATWQGTPVAVKVLTGSAQNKHIAKAILEEFKAEINLLKGMRHPNICLYMGACLHPPNRAIVTELAANGSVWDALRLPLSPPYVPADGTIRGVWPLALYVPDRYGAPPSESGSPRVSAPIPPKGTWPWALVKRVASGAARGMAYLHKGNPPVLHRDLKSANLLLDDSYTTKICDFGLSRLKAQARSMTGNCGTVQWMAPEVLANMNYDEKADVFSYGIILWELLSRECPYEGMTAIQCALAVLNRDKRPDIPKWCPPQLHALIKSCVKKDPEERPSFWQIIMALDAMEA